MGIFRIRRIARCAILLSGMTVCMSCSSSEKAVGVSQEWSLEEARNRLTQYRKSYLDSDLSHRSLFETYFSERFVDEYDIDKLERRFPPYLVIRAMRLPTEVKELNSLSLVDCDNEFGNPNEKEDLTCLRMTGLNVQNRTRTIYIRFKREYRVLKIDYIGSK